MTKSQGWAEDDDIEPSIQNGAASFNSKRNTDGSYGTLSIRPSNFIAPHVEILTLIEEFVKLKGEVASKFYALIADNYDLIRSVFSVIVSKISTLHSFSLTGIQVLRRIVEFAVQCLSQWQINVPTVSFGTPSASAQYPSYGTPSKSSGNFNRNGYY